MFLGKDYSLSTWFTLALAIWVALQTTFFFLLGESPTAGSLTVTLCFILSSVVVFSLQNSKNTTSFDLLSILAFSILVYFVPRLFQYLTVKQENLKQLYILFPMHWSQGTVDYGLYYIILGILSIFVGFKLANLCQEKLQINTQMSDKFAIFSKPSLLALFLTGAIIYAVDGYYTIYQGLSAASNCSIPDIPGKWLIHFFSGDIFIFVVIGFMLKQGHLSALQRYSFLMLQLSIYLSYTLALGSRGGTLRLLAIFFSFFVAYRQNFRIKIWQIILIFPALLFSSIALYKIGTVIRETHRYSCGDGSFAKAENFTKELGNYSAGYSTDPRFTKKFVADERNLTRFDLPPKYSKILDRMGVLDYPIGILSMTGDKASIDKYMSFEHIGKNIYNNIVLGTPYPEATEMTNNMMPIIYRGFNLKHIKENFLSEPWTLWGIGYIYFGYFGGLIFICFFSFFTQSVYNFIPRVTGHLQVTFKAFFLWIYLGACFYFIMGFDHAFVVLVYGLAQLITTLGILFLIEKMLSKFRRPSAA